MPYQLISDTEKTALQFGSSVIKFALEESETGKKWVSEHISKEIADDAAVLEGIVVAEVRDAEADAKADDDAKAKADPKTKADSTKADSKAK